MRHSTAWAALFLFLGVFGGQGQTSLGNVVADSQMAVLGVRSDRDDGFAFVTFVDLDTSAQINFTDRRFLGGGDGSGEGTSGGSWTSAESIFTWSNDTGAVIPRGTVIIVTDNRQNPDTADLGLVTSSNDMGFSANGESLYAFTGNFAVDGSGNTYLDGDLLFGIQFSSNRNNGTGQANPSGAYAVLEFTQDNGQFTGLRDQDITYDDYLAQIIDLNNWSTMNNGAAFGPLDSVDLVGVPEPGQIGLLVFGLAGAVLAYRKRKRFNTTDPARATTE